MSEGCDLLEQSTGFLVGYPRAPFASVVTPLVAGLPCVSSPLETHRRVLWGTLLGTWGQGPGTAPGGVVGKPSREGSGRPLRDPPKKGGPGPPQKGGCRDTKQCKFWRVSSVLIQGLFCFLGVRGGLRGGPPGGRFWGVSGVGPSAREPGDTPPVVRPGGTPLDGTLDKRTLAVPSLRATSGGVARAGGHSARGESSDGDGRVTQQHRGHNLMTSDCYREPRTVGESPRCVILRITEPGVRALTRAEVPYFAQGGRNPLALYPQLP